MYAQGRQAPDVAVKTLQPKQRFNPSGRNKNVKGQANPNGKGSSNQKGQKKGKGIAPAYENWPQSKGYYAPMHNQYSGYGKGYFAPFNQYYADSKGYQGWKGYSQSWAPEPHSQDSYWSSGTYYGKGAWVQNTPVGKGAKGKGKNQGKGSRGQKPSKSKKKIVRGGSRFDPNPIDRKSSLLTTLPLAQANDLLSLYNARAETFPSGDKMIGPLEVIFIDRSKPEDKAGVIIAFHGMEPTKGIMTEWSQIPEMTKWLEMGFTLALPNLEMHSAIHKTDVEKYVRCTMGSQKVNTCILLGKGWGGNVAIQYALDHPNQVKGLILLAPSGPPRMDTNKLKMPVFVAWAEGDPVIPIEESGEFIAELRSREAPTAVKLSSGATHNFADVLENDDTIQNGLKHFVAVVTIMSQMNRFEVVKRLSTVLPERLQSKDPIELRKLMLELPTWVRSGLLTAQE